MSFTQYYNRLAINCAHEKSIGVDEAGMSDYVTATATGAQACSRAVRSLDCRKSTRDYQNSLEARLE